MVFQLWPWLPVITGYFSGIIHSINGVFLVLITNSHGHNWNTMGKPLGTPNLVSAKYHVDPGLRDFVDIPHHLLHAAGCSWETSKPRTLVKKGAINYGPGIGPQLFWIWFCIFGRSAFPALFLAICSILKQEAAISSVFATFWCSKFSCCMVFCD